MEAIFRDSTIERMLIVKKLAAWNIGIERVTNNLDLVDNYKCAICLNFMVSPVSIKKCNDHLFCLRCLHSLFTSGPGPESHPDHRMCPICRALFTKDDFGSIGRIYKEVQLQFLIKCENNYNGCSYVGKVTKLLAHEITCKYDSKVSTTCSTCKHPVLGNEWKDHNCQQILNIKTELIAEDVATIKEDSAKNFEEVIQTLKHVGFRIDQMMMRFENVHLRMNKIENTLKKVRTTFKNTIKRQIPRVEQTTSDSDSEGIMDFGHNCQYCSLTFDRMGLYMHQKICRSAPKTRRLSFAMAVDAVENGTTSTVTVIGGQVSPITSDEMPELEEIVETESDELVEPPY